MNLENSMRLVYKEEKPSITIPSSNRFYFILTIIMKYPSSSLDLDTTLKEFVEPLTVANYLPSSFLSCFFYRRPLFILQNLLTILSIIR